MQVHGTGYGITTTKDGFSRLGRGGKVVGVEVVMVFGVAKEIRPFVFSEIGKIISVGRDGVEVIVEDDMKLRSDLSGVQVEHKGNGAGMRRRLTDVDEAV